MENHKSEIEHWLLPTENVLDNYLVDSLVIHEITDFSSFHTLPSSIVGHQNCSILQSAYSYYNVSTKTPLFQLVNDAYAMAKQKDYDVFNTRGVMQNESSLKELKFGPDEAENTYIIGSY